jgi:hypothetical protein
MFDHVIEDDDDKVIDNNEIANAVRNAITFDPNGA